MRTEGHLNADGQISTEYLVRYVSTNGVEQEAPPARMPLPEFRNVDDRVVDQHPTLALQHLIHSLDHVAHVSALG